MQLFHNDTFVFHFLTTSIQFHLCKPVNISCSITQNKLIMPTWNARTNRLIFTYNQVVHVYGIANKS